MKYSLTCCAKVIVQIALLEMTLVMALACGEARRDQTGGPLPISAESVSGYPSRPVRASIKWDGEEYDVETAIDVLMNVIRDPETARHERELGLIHLTMAGKHLRGDPCLRELETLYDKAGQLEKLTILRCFLGSRDPRSIPVFTRVLDNEKNMKLRLAAASGLAGWNVRRGVAELVGLLESKDTLPQPARMPYVRDNAQESFRNVNARKGWGFPFEEVGQSIGQRTDLSADEKGSLFVAEINKWFAENEHRFPDWKLGDPLPEIELQRQPDRAGSDVKEEAP